MQATRSFRSNGSNTLSSIFLWFSVLLISLGMLPNLIPYYFQLKYWGIKNDSWSASIDFQKTQRLLVRLLNMSFFSCLPFSGCSLETQKSIAIDAIFCYCICIWNVISIKVGNRLLTFSNWISSKLWCSKGGWSLFLYTSGNEWGMWNISFHIFEEGRGRVTTSEENYQFWTLLKEDE